MPYRDFQGHPIFHCRPTIVFFHLFSIYFQGKLFSICNMWEIMFLLSTSIKLPCRLTIICHIILEKLQPKKGGPTSQALVHHTVHTSILSGLPNCSEFLWWKLPPSSRPCTEKICEYQFTGVSIPIQCALLLLIHMKISYLFSKISAHIRESSSFPCEFWKKIIHRYLSLIHDIHFDPSVVSNLHVHIITVAVQMLKR